MKQRLSMLWVLLLSFVVGAWADTTVLSNPGSSVTTHSDANGIITIEDSKGGIQAGSGSFVYGTGDEDKATPMKLSGARQFSLTYEAGATISKVTLYGTSNGTSEATLGVSSSDRKSLGTLPAKGSTPVEIDITNVTGLNASAQFLAIIVVEYTSTTPVLKTTPNALALATNPSKPSVSQTFTITGKNLTDGTYALTVPNLAGLSVSPAEFTVSGGAANQEFEVTYASTEDVAKNSTDIIATVGDLTATVAVTYQSRAEAYTQSTVSADATWDWSQLAETVELTETSVPSKADQFLLADLDDQINFTEGFGDAKAIVMQNIQRPSNAGSAQGTYIKFKTSVPGTLSVDFSNTGGGDRPQRYLNVNGENTTFSSNSTTKVSATGIKVPAGEVVLMGNMVDATADGGFTPNQLRYYKISFVADPTYAINKAVWPEGAATFTLDKETAAAGETVKITDIQLGAGFTSADFVTFGVQGESGEPVKMTMISDGGNPVSYSEIVAYEFVMPAEPVTVNMTFKEPTGTKATFDFVANEWGYPTVSSSLDRENAPLGTFEKDGAKVVFKRAGGNQGYYYKSGDLVEARMINKNILKVIAPEGKAITKVVFTTSTQYNLSGDGLTEKTWTGNATRATFTAGGSCYFTQIDVTYDDINAETADPEEADESIILDFNDPTAHSEFNVTENTYLTQDIVLSDGPAEQGSRVKTTIPFIEGAADANQNYIRISGLNVSMYLRGGKVVFEADGDKVIKNIKMTSAAFNATLNGETVTKDQITGDGWNGNSSRVEMEVTGGTNITDITFTLGDKPVPVAVKYPIEAVVTPAEALTFDYSPTEAAAGEEVTVTLSNPVFGEGYSSADLLTATRSLKTESGTDVEYTLDPLTWSIKFTMPAEKVIASFEFAEKAKEYEDIVVVPAEGADIYEAVQTASEGKNVRNITVYLEPGKQFTVSQTIVAPAAFAIIGAAEGTAPSTIDWTATMAEIDASALTGPMVQMSEEPAVEADANGFYPIEDAGFINVKVTGLKQQLFYANRQKYLINSFHVNFCNINVAGGNKTIIDTNGGGVIADLDMSKNTIWAEPAHTGALYSSQSGQKATEAGLAEQVFNIEKNTFYNIAYGKNVNTHRQSNQTWLTYNVRNNVFVNTGKSGQAIKGLNGGGSSDNPTWNVDGNAFNFDGADTSAAESTGDAAEPVQNSVAGVFAFTDAATGDFNGVFKGTAAEAPAKYPGDPRWSYTYEIAPTDIVVNPEDITDGDISAAFAAKTEGVAKIGYVSINLDGATNYTVAAPIVVPGTVEIVGNGATIDASGMTGNGIVQYVPYEAPADATPETPVVWTEANVSFSGLTVKGLNKALFYSNSKNYYATLFAIDNCVIEQAGDATTIDYTKGSVALNFVVQNSTIYAPTATTKSFYSSQAGQKATEYDDYATQTFTFQSNTLYNLTSGKNLFTHRQNNQKWLIYNIAENIIVNCGKSGQAVKSFNGGGVSSNPTWAVIGNVFNFNGADTSAAESTGDDTEGETVMNSYTGVVTFTDAATGDFSGTFAYTGEAPASLTAGDPRWTLTLEEATPTGINGASLNDNVEMINDNDTPAYNLAGQKVGKNYKGIVIKNGKKVVMK